MAIKFQDKYRIPSARLPHWNYSQKGAYFITICTKDRKPYFGKILNANMELSAIGLIANVFWYEIKNHSNSLELGEFIVMPNHVHGIIILKGEETVVKKGDSLAETMHIDVEPRHALALHPIDQTKPPPIGSDRFQNQGKNTISSIIGGYKAAVTKHANRLGLEFGWQTRFHDHIIRDEKSFLRISEYIRTNPNRWKDDKFYQ